MSSEAGWIPADLTNLTKDGLLRVHTGRTLTPGDHVVVIDAAGDDQHPAVVVAGVWRDYLLRVDWY